MRIHELHIDGFGRWHDLGLTDFADGLNVIYGPNESGKTTLLQFIRSTLYGFSPPRRQRYLPPIDGGAAGGSIVLSDHRGEYTVSRHDDGSVTGEVSITEDGVPVRADSPEAIAAVDEAVFNNVFAIGLREIQELATLCDADVAARLYDLAAGVDRVSLTETMRELHAARSRLFAVVGQPSLIGQLFERRQRLREEVNDLHALNERYAALVQARRDIDEQIVALETSVPEAQYRLHIADAAIAVADQWLVRADSLRQLAELPEPLDMPSDPVRRLELCKDRIRCGRRYVRRLKQRRAQIKTDASELKVNENWLRHAPHLAALASQQEWIATQQQRAVGLEAEVDSLRQQIETEAKRLGIEQNPSVARLHQVSPRLLQRLHPLHEALRLAAAEHERIEQQAEEFKQAAAAATREIEVALAGSDGSDLMKAIDQASEQAQQLRRRIQLDAHVELMEQSLVDLDQRSLAPLSTPLLSTRALIGLGSLFVIGVPLLFAWAAFGGTLSTTAGWLLGLLGLVGVAAAIALKVHAGRASVRAMESCQQQLVALGQQIQDAKHEREKLDEQTPPDSASLGTRLREAERQLDELRKLLPRYEQHKVYQIKAAKSRVAADDAASRRQLAQAAWDEALQEAGLDAGLSFGKLHELKDDAQYLAELQVRLHDRERELHQIQQTHQEYLLRVRRLFHELGFDPCRVGTAHQNADSLVGSAHPTAVAELHDLQEELHRQEESLRRREQLRSQYQRLQRRITEACRQGKRWSRRRQRLLQQAGAKDEPEFFHLMEQAERSRDLRDQTETLDREIGERLGDVPAEDVASLLHRSDAAALPEVRQTLQSQLEQSEEDLLARYERRGELDGELKRLGKDNSMAERRLDLAVVEQQLAEATEQWQVLAATSFFLDAVRDKYQRERQPEVLQEASRYLAGMTEGRYVRVWTPLGEDVLRVDTAEGDALAVEVLSRGTREQLFLSLRLALVQSYAQRGVELPIVLDDVLVNFDAGRSKAATKVLRDFAADGHQLLVFTCHEHMAKMFRRLRVPVRTLGEEEAAVTEGSPAAA